MKGKRKPVETPDGKRIRQREFTEIRDEREKAVGKQMADFEWEAAIDNLMADFEIEEQHRGALLVAIDDAITEFDVEGIAIDLSIAEVADASRPASELRRQVEKLQHQATDVIAFAFGPDFSPPHETRGEAEAALSTLVGHLSAIAEDAEARASERKARRDGKNEPLRPAVKVLAEFWRGVRGSFSQDQGGWAPGSHSKEDDPKNKELEPTGKGGGRFVYDALALAGVPRIRLRGLATVLREFAGAANQKKKATDG